MSTGSLATPRSYHTATLLLNGKVLVAGGSAPRPLASAELYDPASGTWTSTGSLTTKRYQHTATLLPDGKVLVAGGYNTTQGNVVASAELYDLVSGTWTVTGSLANARAEHTATLLPNGKVLVAAGSPFSGGPLTSAELYDPASGIWTATGSLATGRSLQRATLLPNGQVLVEGGLNSNAIASAELYDPVSGTWTVTGSLAQARRSHTATLLPNGKVLVAAGSDGSNFLASAELYDSASGIWATTGDLSTARDEHTATLLPNGEVLVTGGERSIGVTLESLASAELYHPAIARWQRVANMNYKRHNHTATLLPIGQVLVTGGANCGDDCPPDHRGRAELYNPTTRTWTNTGSMASSRWNHTATLLPNGKVLVAGGYGRDLHFSGSLVTAELYDPATGVWTPTGSMNTTHSYHTATLLPNGQVLVAGDINVSTMNSAELYDPATGMWTPTGSLVNGRYEHTVTLLPNGQVLVAGGFRNMGSVSAELYNPATGVWTPTGDLTTDRAFHTSTLLPNGQVLVAGGASVASAELYDPATGAWTPTASMTTPRYRHTATLLPNGQLLAAGGRGHDTPPFTCLASAELFDIGLGFVRPDWQPQIATAISLLELGSSLVLTGSRFQGISQGSNGTSQDSSTNYPVVQLRSTDNSQISFLTVDPIAGWSGTAFASTPVNNFPPGPALVTVFTNGIPSDSKSLMIVTVTGHPGAH